MSLDGGSFSFLPYTLNGESAFDHTNIDGLEQNYLKIDGSNSPVGDIKASEDPQTASSLTRKSYVDGLISTRTEMARVNPYGYPVLSSQGIYLGWNAVGTGKNYYVCSKGLGLGGHVFQIHDTLTGNVIWEKEITDYVLHTEMAGYLSPYLLVNTFNVERQALLNAIALKLDTTTFNNTIANYSTTTQMNTAITTALTPYSTTSQMNTAITNALLTYYNKAHIDSNFYTKSQIDGFGYRNTAQVQTAINDSLTSYYTKTQIDEKKWQDAGQVNALISTALSSYATDDDHKDHLDATLLNYVSQTLLNQTLANYTTNSHLTTNYSTTATNNATYKTIASFNSDIANYYTKVQADGRYHLTTTKIIPYTETGNPGYQFRVANKGFVSGSQTYDIEITDNEGVTTSLRFGHGNISTPNTIQGITPTQYSYLNSLTSNVQTQLNSKANTSALNDYVLTSIFNNTLAGYSTTTQMNTVLTSYATVAMLNNYVNVSGHSPFDPNLYYTQAQSNNRYLLNEEFNNTIINYTTTGQLNNLLTSYATVAMLNNYVNVSGHNPFDPNLYYTRTASDDRYLKINHVGNATITGSITARESDEVLGFLAPRILHLGDIAGARYSLATGAFRLTFRKHNAGTGEYDERMYIDDNQLYVVGNVSASSGLFVGGQNVMSLINGKVDNATLNNYYTQTEANNRFAETIVGANNVFQNENYFTNVAVMSGASNLIMERGEFRIHTGVYDPIGKVWNYTVGGRFIVKENGWVGIGRPNPSMALDVLGSGSVSGDFTCNQLTVGGNASIFGNMSCNNLSLNTATATNVNTSTVSSTSINNSMGITTLALVATGSIDTNDSFHKTCYLRPEGGGTRPWAIYSWNDDFVFTYRNSLYQFAGTPMLIRGDTTHMTQTVVNSCPAREQLNVRGGILIENVSPWDTTNYIRWVHNFVSGWGEWRQYTGLDGTGSVGQMRWRLTNSGQAFGSNTDVFILQDNNAGGRLAIINGNQRINSADFLVHRLSRTLDNVNVGVGMEFTLNDNKFGQIYSGRQSFDNWGWGYLAFDPRRGIQGSEFATDWWNARFYMTYDNSVFNNNIILQDGFGHFEYNSTNNDFRWRTRVEQGGGYFQFYRRNGSNWNVMGEIHPTSGQYIAFSDVRFKQNIERLNPVKSLEKILKTNLYSYEFKHDPSSRHIGVLAQEYKETNRHAINIMRNVEEEEKKEGEENLGVAYNDIFIHNVNATKELYKIIEQQQKEIDALKETINKQNETLKNIIEYLNLTKQ